MISEALEYTQEVTIRLDAPIIEQPVLCCRCSAVLVKGMPEEQRDAEIEASDKLMFVDGAIYCVECAPDDPREDEFRRIDNAYEEWKDS